MDDETITKDFIWVAQPKDLQQMVSHLAQQTVIGVDTESNSLFVYQEQVCLIQFSSLQTDYLLDPFALSDLSPLETIFANPSLIKVFHAAEYDLSCLKRDFQFTFANLFDTMLAARIMGQANLGLASLLETHFQVTANKHFQRANWGQASLTPEMMSYARMDTHYLIQLREIMLAQLVSAARLALAEEDFQRMTQLPAGANSNSASHWVRIAGAQDLSPRRAAVLMQLCAFRDEEARALNQPPFRILSNQMLLDLALLMPRRRSQLTQVSGLSTRLIQRYGDGLLAAIERGIVGPPAYRDYNHRPSDPILNRLEALRNWRKNTARNMGVESDVVLPRDVMEAIAERGPRNLDELASAMHTIPWRLNRFGKQILEIIH